MNKEYWKNNLEFFWKLFEAIVIACLLLHMFRHLGDLLTNKILKGRIKNLYCQNRDILGFCENYLKLLHALYNCASNITVLLFSFFIFSIFDVQLDCCCGQKQARKQKPFDLIEFEDIQ